jgi:diaminopimelate epimerase
MGFAKGHGTGNDFVVLVDPDDQFDPSSRFVRDICDRRRGIGADGLLRVAPAPAVAGEPRTPRFFMDYRNADGSLAAMCGNGARVFAAILRETGLESSDEFSILTRGGVRQVTIREDAWVQVGMGAPTLRADAGLVVTPVGAQPLKNGTAVWMPNPHAVFFVEELVAAGELLGIPEVKPASVFPEGVNVEFVVRTGDHQIQMRVHERGVGETLSCGTGACAAAVATAASEGIGPDGRPWRVQVPGGELEVVWDTTQVYLAGPVEIVARGTLDQDWMAAHAV